ncbi:DMT family transporter [Arcobacteraceae bacterium]|nr:DMT family transporter [Arcobacteraceae bacterium]
MKKYTTYILVTLCVLFWSGNFVLGRFIKDDISPIELAFFRWFFVAIFLLPSLFFIDIKKIIELIKSNFIVVSILAILSVSLYNTVLYLALQSTLATNALLINSSTPLIIIILSSIILKTNINKIQILGILISTFGVSFLILKGNFESLTSLEFHDGDFWIMFCAFIWALYSVLLKFKPKGYKNSELFVANMYVGFLFLLPIYLYQGYTMESQIAHVQHYWYFFIYISLFSSILSYIFWTNGVEKIGASKTGQFVHLMPLFGSILAFIFLGEKLQMFHIIGAVFIAIGIYLSIFLFRKDT